MRSLIATISLTLMLGCEQIVDLQPSQNLMVVESWITDIDERQRIRLSVSNGFLSKTESPPLNSAIVSVSDGVNIYPFEFVENGVYKSVNNLNATEARPIAVRIVIQEKEIQSNPEFLSIKTEIQTTNIESFTDNDPQNPDSEIVVYFPKVFAVDSLGYPNFYRWRFYRNSELYTEPESITIQKDRFFDGNLIPNSFEDFRYERGDTIVVELQSISKGAYDYLALLKSQISTLGTSSGTTPSIVRGNLVNASNPNEIILGFFGLTALDRDTLVVN